MSSVAVRRLCAGYRLDPRSDVDFDAAVSKYITSLVVVVALLYSGRWRFPSGNIIFVE